ncbi:hypothetical protein HN371_23745 [Candidatus Poribacteria bacterium]|jgi:hypothetical protein|nr:hypothetical protein [Candidatus Poribacteria bacterium]MBT5534114.1 hypothetical protein [Candidatus Poribacteria bacterium]MBT5711379.1 hypothetical protein [Candidatus Poribacteria bacterium]MBT7101660.1 hypothetical protein [Candidatus Poribacteria bacterium]MBT7806852.1 hypothetical protein [Candidatus Poribacteria bacterium]
MSVSSRRSLHELIEALPDAEIEAARRALQEPLERATLGTLEDAQARVERRLLEAGQLAKIPRREDILGRPKTPRPRLSGKTIAETIIEERR